MEVIGKLRLIDHPTEGETLGIESKIEFHDDKLKFIPYADADGYATTSIYYELRYYNIEKVKIVNNNLEITIKEGEGIDKYNIENRRRRGHPPGSIDEKIQVNKIIINSNNTNKMIEELNKVRETGEDERDLVAARMREVETEGALIAAQRDEARAREVEAEVDLSAVQQETARSAAHLASLRAQGQLIEARLQEALRRRSENSDRNLLPVGWERRQDPESGRYYYADYNTQTTTWDLPIVAETSSTAPAGKTEEKQRGGKLSENHKRKSKRKKSKRRKSKTKKRKTKKKSKC